MTAPTAPGRWGTPSAELIMTADDVENDRPRWLELRRQGIGGSDVAALMGDAKYSTEYDVWYDKTGRGAEVDISLQMEMGSRWEAAVAAKFADDRGVEIRRRGMMRFKDNSILLYNADRLCSDGYGLECKAVNQFTKLPSDLEYRGGIPGHWYWQCVLGILVTGRAGWHLAVAIGNSDFQVRTLDANDPRVQDDMARILEVVPQWWLDHVLADAAPAYEGLPDKDNLLEGSTYEAMIPGLLVEQRDRLREIRETRRDLKREEDDLKAKLLAEAGNAEWLLASGQPLLHFNPVKGRASFQKAQLFKRRPVDGLALLNWLGANDGADLSPDQIERLIDNVMEFEMTEEQYTKTGNPSRSLLIVGDPDKE